MIDEIARAHRLRGHRAAPGRPGLIELDGTRTRASSAPTRSSRLARRREGRGDRPTCRCSATSRPERPRAARPDDEHPQRWVARRLQRRHPGVHGRPDRRPDLPRGPAHRRRGLPLPQVRAEEQGPVDRPRRRGRLRAEPRVEPRRARPHPRRDREGRLRAGQGRRAGPGRRRHRVLQGRRVPVRGQGPHPGRDDRVLRAARVGLPAGVHRRPAVRGRVGHLVRARVQGRRQGADRRRRPVRHQRSAWPRASSSRPRTRCW